MNPTKPSKDQLAYASRLYAALARACQLRLSDLLGPDRRQCVTFPRFLAWRILHHRGATLAEIAGIANRSLSAVCQGLRSLEAWVASSPWAAERAARLSRIGLRTARGPFPTSGHRKTRPELAHLRGNRRAYLTAYARIWRAERRAARTKTQTQSTP